MPRPLDLSNSDPLVSVPAAIEAVTGARPHPVTCTRWVIQGVGGVILPSALIGTRRVTTERAVRQWIAERTELDIAKRERAHRELLRIGSAIVASR